MSGKRVLVRADFNVPMNHRTIAEDLKIRESLPTIDFLAGKGARVILMSHLGRPDGKRVAGLSLAPVAKHLGTLLGRDVLFVPDLVGRTADQALHALQPGEIALLENVRFSPNESGGNMRALAIALARTADLFVQECFAVAHRKSATISVLPTLLPSYAGLLLEKEIRGLTKIIRAPRSPFVAIIGGAKLETKIPVLDALLPNVDTLLVGGGIVNTYLKARGYEVGNSLTDDGLLAAAARYGKKRKIIWPVDVIVGKKTSVHGRRVVLGKAPQIVCKKGEAIYDIGPATIRLYASYIQQAKTIVWNGALGWFEERPYHIGTFSIARLIGARAKGKAFGVVGGGETVQAATATHVLHDIDLVSTGGGAMLEFLAGEKLPGIEALR